MAHLRKIQNTIFWPTPVSKCISGVQEWQKLVYEKNIEILVSKQPIFGLTQEWFRELSFSRLECGVHDR